ncbi:MAG: hypothetical protein FJX54_10335 [Alphaproteobacteria bacterium]|nr:hypothetical protein [Alphaproteobacteria bacterium]
MMRYLALAAALLLAATPIRLHDGGFIVTLSVLGAALMLSGIMMRSLMSAAVGGALALFAYAGALWWTASEPGAFEAILLSLALMLVIDAADLGRSLGGAEISAAALRLFHLGWVVTALIGAGVALGLAGIVALADLGAPPVMRPILAGAGGFLALAAALLLLRKSR